MWQTSKWEETCRTNSKAGGFAVSLRDRKCSGPEAEPDTTDRNFRKTWNTQANDGGHGHGQAGQGG